MVNINTVYQRVLLLANKEQRGYITPEEFNSFADQAQREIFEGYIAKKIESSALPMTTDEYGDVAKIVDERLTYFDNVLAIDKTTLNAQGRATEGFAYPDNFWSLGLVNVNGRMADEVSHRDLTYINLSPLTSPTEKQPIYTRHEGGVVVYPNTVESIDLVYLRVPTVPSWAYMDDPTGDPIYDEANSIQFELNTAEEANLVYRILALSGLAIKQQDLLGFGKSEEK